jgi:single-stranded-DNA-specific exonuclease
MGARWSDLREKGHRCIATWPCDPFFTRHAAWGPVLETVEPVLRRRAEAGAAWLAAQKQAGGTVTVVHHVDADGVTSGGIALETLARAGIASHEIMVKSLDQAHIDRIAATAPQALWFTDLGSTAYMHFPTTPRLVCDHHELVRDGSEESFAHFNPKLDDLPGDCISGAGGAFLVALAYDAANLDLLPLALVGAAADLQDRRGGFHGANRALVTAGQQAGLIEARQDVAWFGPETRDLVKFLSLARDPVVPGVTGDRRAAEDFLDGLGIDASRPWSLLADGQRQAIRSALVRRVLAARLGAEHAESLFCERIFLAHEKPGTPLHEVQEYGTLLNSTARYGRPEIGLAVVRGDRAAGLDEALGLLLDHRKHLVGALAAFAQSGVTELNGVQWVHLQDRVRDTVVGIVAGMALDGLGLRRDLPLLAFAHTPDGQTKASARAPHEVQGRVDLATAMREAAARLGGHGGGHQGAAGATFPRGLEEAFIAHVNATVAAQLAAPTRTGVA